MNLIDSNNPLVSNGLNFVGFRVLENSNLVDTIKVNRNWKERLFGLPWRPWRRTKLVDKPMEKFIRLPNGTILGHPVFVQRLREELRKQETGLP